MGQYVDRLIKCGMPPHEAYNTCESIIKGMGEAELEVYINIIESTIYGAPYVD